MLFFVFSALFASLEKGTGGLPLCWMVQLRGEIPK